jgi:Flp pilus assembly protein TadG
VERRGRVRRFLWSEHGQSLVETALALPLMAFTLLGGADMARAFAIQLAVQNGARAGAEATALDITPTSAEATAHAQQEMDRTPGMTATGATITVTFTQANGVLACTGAANISVAGTSSISVPCYARVRVQYSFSTLIPWPGLPRTFAFDRVTMFRRYQ